MSDKKNIDRLFQEKFKNFEANPSDAVWNRINGNLNKKKKRRVIPIWFQFVGVAATIALLITLGIKLFGSETTETVNPYVNGETPDKILNEKTKTNFKTNENTEVVENDLDTKNIKENSETSNTKSSYKNEKSTQQNNSTEDALANQNKSKSKSSKLNTKGSLFENLNNNFAQSSNNSNKNPTELNTNNFDKHKEATVTQKDALNTNLNASNSPNDLEEKTKDAIKDLEKESIEDAVANNDKEIEKEDEEAFKRWSINTNAAPVVFGSLGKGSAIGSQFNENQKTSSVNMSYGFSGTYAVSKRLKVRAGINNVNLNSITSGVYTFSGAEATARGFSTSDGYENINFKNNNPITLMSSVALNRASAPEVFNSKVAGNLEQRFGFIEVPLEVEYRLLDKRFGINVNSGFSTLFLNTNEIYAEVEGNSILIGEANNINDTSFSANLGLGFDYKISKQWSVNVEPKVKYQVNTFDNTSGNFNPFFVGVYTGLNFEF